mmetsp:Transcript_25840/g.64131  ORF Transcript_25840/g.64131 Transcript_25840/m.64131 type:complete len:220 (-) Transcript_25840:1440-2099(-)
MRSWICFLRLASRCELAASSSRRLLVKFSSTSPSFFEVSSASIVSRMFSRKASRIDRGAAACTACSSSLCFCDCCAAASMALSWPSRSIKACERSASLRRFSASSVRSCFKSCFSLSALLALSFLSVSVSSSSLFCRVAVSVCSSVLSAASLAAAASSTSLSRAFIWSSLSFLAACTACSCFRRSASTLPLSVLTLRSSSSSCASRVVLVAELVWICSR